jgi:hypothetical protein
MSQQAIGIPNDNYTYQTMMDYVNGLGDYWIRLVEQMIPATTIWLSGTKFENSIFHRQKFVYRVQRGCAVIPVPCTPCSMNGPLFPYNCADEMVTCSVYPWNGSSTVQNFKDVLYQTVTQYINSNSLTNCNSNTLSTYWYLDLRLDGQILIQGQVPINGVYRPGLGYLDVPTQNDWLNSLNNYLPQLINNGFNYSINGDTLYISNSGCDAKYTNKPVQLNVGLDFTINCS